MSRSVPLILIGLLLGSCGSSTRPISIGPGSIVHPRPQPPLSLRHSTASNRQAAFENVRNLIRVVVVPPGARQVARIPQSAPVYLRDEAKGFRQHGTATTHRIWVVRMPLKSVVRYVRTNARPRPRPEAEYRTGVNRIGSRPDSSYEFPPIPGRSWSRYLNVDMAPLSNGSTIVFAQAGDEWTITPPRTAEIPEGVKHIEVVSRYWKERPSVHFGNSNLVSVGAIVALTNGLGVVPPKIFCATMFEYGPTVTLTFNGRNGRVLARAQVSDPGGSGRSGPCNPLELTIGKRTTALIGADLLLRIQRMLGVHLAPPLPRDVASCLRSNGWSVNHVAARMLARHNGKTWRITFDLNGNVGASPSDPPVLRHCMRSTPGSVLYG